MSGLYVHVPFCARACPYCDFDFRVGRQVPVQEYLAALDREYLAREHELQGMSLTSAYLGGGTPSLLGPEGLKRLLAWLEYRFALQDLQELTVELNPEHVSEPLLRALVGAGVDRVSLGIQTLDAAGLRTLGRVHTPRQALEGIRRARAAGLRTSVDLILGWPGQTASVLDADVQAVVASDVQHVSVYALSIEPGTPWVSLVRRRQRTLPDEQHQAQLLQHAERTLQVAGYDHYEVSSYARPGQEARHNTGYWTWRNYVGLGPSAHSAWYGDTGEVVRRGNRRGYGRWVVEPDATDVLERLPPRTAAAEGLWTGLRRLDGLDTEAYLRRFPAVTRSWLEARVRGQVAAGNLRWGSGGARLAVAPGRWLFHDAICAELLEG